jgi:hypothetical protein
MAIEFYIIGQLWNDTKEHSLYILDLITQYIVILPMFTITASVKNIGNSHT